MEAIELEVGSSLLQEIRKGQLEDEKIQEIKCNIKEEKSPRFTEDGGGVLWYMERICVLNIKELKDKILHEAHESAYSIHAGGNKMYHDVEHQQPAGLLQPLQVPEWKWEEIAMGFIVGLPRTQSGYDSIWVIMDRLTKVAHFIPVKTTYSRLQLVELYMLRIVCVHGVPKMIGSDRGTQFTSKFCERLHEALNTQSRLSSTYHPQIDGQTERVNHILEDMLRACVVQYGRSWDKSLPYAVFNYNNSYQDSLKMAPFEMLYDRRC
jgi:hypothetical protein